MKKLVIAFLVLMLVVLGMVNALVLVAPATDDGLDVECISGGVIEKMQQETFTVKVTFKNIGDTKGTWSVNVAFEGAWTWTGTPKNLTLKPCYKKTLTWTGMVPCDAPIGSTARLIVYYNDNFVLQDWWILVVSDAELTVVSSVVT